MNERRHGSLGGSVEVQGSTNPQDKKSALHPLSQLFLLISAGLGIALICMGTGVFGIFSELSIAAGAFSLVSLTVLPYLDIELTPTAILNASLGIALICMSTGVFDFNSELTIATGVLMGLPIFAILAGLLLVGGGCLIFYAVVSGLAPSSNNNEPTASYEQQPDYGQNKDLSSDPSDEDPLKEDSTFNGPGPLHQGEPSTSTGSLLTSNPGASVPQAKK